MISDLFNNSQEDINDTNNINNNNHNDLQLNEQLDINNEYKNNNSLDNVNIYEEYTEKKSKKRSNAITNSISVNPDDVKLILDKLEFIIKKDKELIKKEEPAVEKLKILPHLEKLLVKKKFSEEFLRQGGLRLLQEYLAKNNDNTFPFLNQLERVIDLLELMPIEKNYLEECYISSYLTDIIKNIKNSSNIFKKKAKNLYNKWMRIISDAEVNYTTLDNENEAYKNIFNKNKRKREPFNNEENDYKLQSNTNDSKYIYEQINKNRKVPQKSLFDYTIAPENKTYVIKDSERYAKKNFFQPSKKEGVKSNKKSMILNEL